MRHIMAGCWELASLYQRYALTETGGVEPSNNQDFRALSLIEVPLRPFAGSE